MTPPIKPNLKAYLGDSVYAEHRGQFTILTTENGKTTDPSNTIVLDDSVILALTQHISHCKAAVAHYINDVEAFRHESKLSAQKEETQTVPPPSQE